MEYHVHLTHCEISIVTLLTFQFQIPGFTTMSIKDIEHEIMEKLKISTSKKNLCAMFDRVQGRWITRIVQHLIGDRHDAISIEELIDIIGDLRERLRSDSLPVDFLDVLVP